MKTLVYILIVVGVSLCSVFSYDVEEEIKELQALYGDQVLDRPCRSTEDCDSHHRIRKRFLLNTYCDAVLGCFPTDGVFSERLVNFNPNSRETVNTRFELFTKKNPTTGQRLSADEPHTLTSSLFRASKHTVFVVHGFLESSRASWFKPLTDELLNRADYNVINVDWGGIFASKTLYTQATANTRVVAAEIIHLLNTMRRQTDINFNDVHIIGHSLGAHIAGYVGANITGIGRISGLDPAEPYFEGYSTALKLDPSDALFVDVIHSDADSILEVVKGEGGFGSKELSGHADFFPNGGEDQPLCKNGVLDNVKLENSLYEGLKRFFACDHDRAVKYFTESVNNCPFTSVSCMDYVDFEYGRCSIICSKHEDHCNSMGYHARKPKSSNRKYYLQTSGVGDFCATNYDIKVTLDRNSAEAMGTIDLTFHGSKNLKQMLRVNKGGDKMVPSNTYVYHAGVHNSLGNVVGLEVTWTKDLAWWRVVSKACSWVGLCSSSLKIKEIELQDADGNKLHFCGSGRDFPSGTARYLFYSATSCV